MGESLRTNKSAVDHWIAGAMPSGQTGRYLTIALSRRLGRTLTLDDLGLPVPVGWENDSIGLSIGEDPLDALVPIWRGDLDRRGFLSGAAYSVAAAVLPLEHVSDIASRAAKARTGARIGHADVAAVRDMVAMFSVMDERHGGQHGRSALVQYLMSDVAALCRGRFSSEDDHRHMLSAAAVGVHQAGWRAYDGGEQGLAQRYYLQSFALARESGITGHDAFVMRTMSQQGMKLHRPEHCLALATSALATSAVDGAAATSRPPGTYARIVALNLVAQAEMQAAEDSVEEACATWGRAIDHMDRVQSGRTRKAVGNMRRDLSRFRTRQLRCATELDERARDFLSDRR
ncbi:hypothetical protein [Streptomyces celluloflavus]|uniref:hypothetical protein n=1 Tax=Streptomyces celluloflavus TaxID=58344 RepID=UPI0036C62368